MAELPDPTPWCHRLLKPDGSSTPCPPKGRHYTLEEMQRAVDGFIEIVHLKGGRRRHLMVINEEGKLHGLPLNERATSLYDTFPDCIVGNALVCLDGDID
ncbi:MAG: DUF3846 domain-containing protein [Chloroflexota bacterium]|nr:DUF3846 domain-containing protein [Chloroflexota bacterium]